MDDVIRQEKGTIGIITLNRAHKRNAFNDAMMCAISDALIALRDNPRIRVIVLNANGPDFCSGADLEWMQRTATLSYDENVQDALVLANLLYTLYSCPKPTVALVQGAAYGGGAGLIAACDIAIGTTKSQFCFSEVKIGLIPAVISPYVVKALGTRAATALFISAERIPPERAMQLQLLHHCVKEEELLSFGMDYASQLSQLAPEAVIEAKALVRDVCTRTIDPALQLQTAQWIAKKRASSEGQEGIQAFLKKTTPNWNRHDDV